MINQIILSDKAKRALKAFSVIMNSLSEEFEIYSFSCTGGTRYFNKKKETACRIVCKGYQCDCLYYRDFNSNLILACALSAYAILNDWGNFQEKFGMWKVTKYGKENKFTEEISKKLFG